MSLDVREESQVVILLRRWTGDFRHGGGSLRQETGVFSSLPSKMAMSI